MLQIFIKEDEATFNSSFGQAIANSGIDCLPYLFNWWLLTPSGAGSLLLLQLDGEVVFRDNGANQHKVALSRSYDNHIIGIHPVSNLYDLLGISNSSTLDTAAAESLDAGGINCVHFSKLRKADRLSIP